ncbi:LysR family transcriptional regulator [Suttonella sp. R2A3]|uniref:LysR family transcriptional regulator n=1 Tax=Suttonella sp. R2A3 TaxID=2908648 RepID=UPI0038FCDFD9
MLERHHLAIIRAVVDQGTLTQAANTLHLSQSALSHTIKKLEDHIGVHVWQKDGRRLRLTRAGEELHEMACRLLPQFEHAEAELQRYAKGRRGSLRIGMECHPCYRWLLTIVHPYLQAWPEVDLDVKQQFQFSGINALINHEVDVLITPDPVHTDGLTFSPVFAYEQVLVVANNHHLAGKTQIDPHDLSTETLLTYPVPSERLDIFTQFLQPAHTSVAAHKTIETTEILLELVAAGRGVAAMPRWLIEQHEHLALRSLRLGDQGIHKYIYLGARNLDLSIDYLTAFIELAATQ